MSPQEALAEVAVSALPLFPGICGPQSVVVKQVSATAATCFRALQVVALRPPDDAVEKSRPAPCLARSHWISPDWLTVILKEDFKACLSLCRQDPDEAKAARTTSFQDQRPNFQSYVAQHKTPQLQVPTSQKDLA